MRLSSSAIFSLILVIAPNIATACEGECITGVTNAFARNYTNPVHITLGHVANKLVSQCFPSKNIRRKTASAASLLEPIVTAYDSLAAKRMKKAIFPSYFHGKCQRPDPNNPSGPFVNPPGCPNPDCPVVCGTPGSMVHFYSKLRSIVFTSASNSLREVASPGTDAYKEVSRRIKAEMAKAKRGLAARGSEDSEAKIGRSQKSKPTRGGKKHFCDVTRLKDVISKELESVCGGVMNGLPGCSWEREMKQYILSFP